MSKQNRITVASYLEIQIAVSEISQKDIATAIGYDKPNVITMIKQGKTKLPLNKVGPLAKVLGIDPVHLLRLAMSEYHPDTWLAINHIIGRWLVTDGEMTIISWCEKFAAISTCPWKPQNTGLPSLTWSATLPRNSSGTR